MQLTDSQPTPNTIQQNDVPRHSSHTPPPVVPLPSTPFELLAHFVTPMTQTDSTALLFTHGGLTPTIGKTDIEALAPYMTQVATYLRGNTHSDIAWAMMWATGRLFLSPPPKPQ